MIAASSAAIAADDPGGWSKANWGMTADQILAAFPGEAARMPEPDKYNHAAVSIDSIDVAGTTFRVYFIPDDAGRLAAVNIQPRDMAGNSESTFQSVENLLVEKYGRPWKSDDAETELQWTFPTTTLTLAKTTLPGSRAVFVSLTYTHRIPASNPF